MADHKKLPLIEVGFQLYAAEDSEEFGAVREVAPRGRPEIVIDVEGAGYFTVRLSAVSAVHDGKVILAVDKLDHKLREAIRHAHDAEDPTGP